VCLPPAISPTDELLVGLFTEGSAVLPVVDGDSREVVLDSVINTLERTHCNEFTKPESYSSLNLLVVETEVTGIPVRLYVSVRGD